MRQSDAVIISHIIHYEIQYPLVNVNKKLWKDQQFFMGKLTISMAIFNSYVTNYQRVLDVEPLVSLEVCERILWNLFAGRSTIPNISTLVQSCMIPKIQVGVNQL